MPINKWKTAHLVIAFAWATHALSWFLPVVAADEVYRGWGAFQVALSPIVPNFHLDAWYYSVLALASAATTFTFVVGSPLAVWRGSRSVRRACAWAAITAFVVNSHWYIFWFRGFREDLRVGYFLWWLSFGLLAIGLFKLSSNSRFNQYRRIADSFSAIKRIVRRAVAAFFVFVLVFGGVSNGIELAGSSLNDAFLVFAATLGAALFHFLAYFVRLRDIVGGSISTGAMSLRYRWSSFARSTAVVCVILMWLNELGDLFARRHLVWTISTLLLSSLLIPTWVLSTEEYLAINEGASESSALPREWRGLEQLTTILSDRIRGRRSLVLGGILVVASIFFRWKSWEVGCNRAILVDRFSRVERSYGQRNGMGGTVRNTGQIRLAGGYMPWH